MAIVCLLTLAVIWFAIIYQASYDRRLALSAAEISTTNLAMAFEEHVEKNIENIDGLLLQLRHEYQKNPLALAGRIRFLAEHKSVNELLIQVNVTNKLGVVVFSTNSLPATPIDISDREHFRVHLMEHDDRLFISKPVIGRVSKKWSIQFTRKVVTDTGSFAGVIVLSIDPDYFANYYKGIDLGSGGAISLVGTDGIIRARASKTRPALEAIGLAMPKDRVFFDPAKPATGIYKMTSAVDGVPRIGAYRRLNTYPLVVLVLHTEKDVLASVNTRVMQTYYAGLILSVLVLFVGALYWSDERRRISLLKALLDSEEAYRTVANFTFDWEYWRAPDRNLRYVSPSCERHTGYSSEEFIQDPSLMTKIVHPDDRDQLGRHLGGEMNQDDFQMDFRIITRSGEIHWFAHACQPVYDKNGKFLGQRATNRNITDRKNMELELLESKVKLLEQNEELLATDEELRVQILEFQETHDHLLATEEMLRVQLEVSETNQHLLSETSRKLETIINASPLAIISLGHSGQINLWNQTATDIFGCTAEDIGHTLMSLFASEDEYEKFIVHLTNDRSIRLPELQFQSYEHDPLIVSIVSAPLIQDSIESDILLMLEDITQQKRIKEQLQHAQKMDVIGRLAGGIAHDYNNMLTGIICSAEVMKNRMAESDRNMKLVNTILNAATRSAELTRELLSFSHKSKRKDQPVDINTTIVAVLELLERTIDKNIILSTCLDTQNPIVLGDSTLLQSALLNLGVNARDAMPDGGILSYATSTITLNAADCKTHQVLLEPGDYLQISVSDTGTGIPKKIINTIFEPFFTTKEQGKGTGLGLSAVYGTVRDHKGSINVYSEPGQGSVFKVFLPLSSATSDLSIQKSGIIKGSGVILLVDDEEILRFTGRDLLEELGYTVFLAADGEQGLEFYTQNSGSVDLVILDMIMPNVNGKKAFLRLKEFDPMVRVLFCSGFHTEGTDQDLIKMGACGFIHKPFNMLDLSRSVAAAIGI